MRSLYGPWAIVAAVALQLASGVAEANNARANADANAALADAQINQEKVAAAREQDKLDADKAQAQGRAMAVIAAGGGSTDAGSGLAILTSGATAFDVTKARAKTDSENTINSLISKRTNTLALGRSAADAAIIGGAGRATSTYAMSSGGKGNSSSSVST